ncbi:MAG: aspartyl protease [Cyanobacteria bacterium J083]|nr:MAG: aspartyl protease [Cyanobacteria bacterium J083]
MNKLSAKLICSILITLVVPPSLNAQEAEGCFMLDNNGNRISLGSLCGTNNNTNNQATGVFTIPIKKRKAGIPVIEVTFNNQYTFEMMLDTGASKTAITSRMAKTLNLKANGFVYVSTPSHKKLRVNTSEINQVAVGDVKAKNIQVAILPALDIGLLGQNFFGKYDITIKNNVIELRRR